MNTIEHIISYLQKVFVVMAAAGGTLAGGAITRELFDPSLPCRGKKLPEEVRHSKFCSSSAESRPSSRESPLLCITLGSCIEEGLGGIRGGSKSCEEEQKGKLEAHD